MLAYERYVDYLCPLYQGNAFTEYGGHSSFVTCARFSGDDSRLLSTGGNDKCIFQWQVKR